MAKYVNVERQIGLKTAFAHLFDHDRFHFFKAMNTNVSLTSEPYVSILNGNSSGIHKSFHNFISWFQTG